jgi:hypothetical protein
MQGDSEPPRVDAIHMAEAFEQYADPELIRARDEARTRYEAAATAVPPQPNWFEGDSSESVERWKYSPARRAAEAASRERQRTENAVTAYGFAQLRAGAWVAWGREGSPVGPWRLLPADAWRYFRFRGGDVVEVRGPSPIRFYGVRVAPAKREETASSALASTVAAEDRCRKWLVDLMVDGRAPSGPKRDYKTQARERFRVGSRAFGRAWDAAIQETGNTSWRAPGRKPKS